MPSFQVNFKNDDYMVVEVEEGDPAPKLNVYYDPNNGVNVATIQNLPEGYSLDPTSVLYIEPSED